MVVLAELEVVEVWAPVGAMEEPQLKEEAERPFSLALRLLSREVRLNTFYPCFSSLMRP